MIRAIATALMLATPAAAQDRISFLFQSDHIGMEEPAVIPLQGGARILIGGYEWEEFNPGIFLTWENALDTRAPIDFTAGVYRNSYGRLSTAGTFAWNPFTGRGWKAGIFAGIAHYPVEGRQQQIHLGDFVPVFGAQIIAGNAFIQVMPQGGKSHVIAVGLTWDIGEAS